MPIPAVAIELGLIGLDYVYHRWFTDDPPVQPPDRVRVPTAQAGAIVPLVWGRVRVDKPFLAWESAPATFDVTTPGSPFLTTPVTSGYAYMLDQFFNVGVGFDGGVHRLKSMWVGDVEMGQNGNPDSPGLSVLNGDGTGGDPYPYAGAMFVSNGFDAVPSERAQGYVEFLNGAPTQTLQVGGSGTRYVGAGMIAAGVDPTLISGFRNYLSVYLFSRSSAPSDHWIFGTSSSLPTVSFEVTSYPAVSLAANVSDFFGGGFDANPIDVLYDVLTGGFAKLAIDPARIDMASFRAAAVRCVSDGLGYSRAIEDITTGDDIIQDIMRHVDGIGPYEDPVDGLIKVKLVRDDFDPATAREINYDNCEGFEGLAIGGWTGVANKVVVEHLSRQNNYDTATITAQNQANAVGQNGEENEVRLSFPGCCTEVMAQIIANREIAARSRPITKLIAKVDRTFKNTVPGDVIAVSWPEYGWDRLLFRVASVSRGTLADGTIRLGLLQEMYQVYRGVSRPPYGYIGSFPHAPTLVG